MTTCIVYLGVSGGSLCQKKYAKIAQRERNKLFFKYSKPYHQESNVSQTQHQIHQNSMSI
ncbi:hypothetical protein DAI22_04g076400 [Oryza sativa Japonica Group]|nr:hypothetical protein DAI22_04g076400 [Oryza sativa Japonica Group]